jgi:hypothetical protein
MKILYDSYTSLNDFCSLPLSLLIRFVVALPSGLIEPTEYAPFATTDGDDVSGVILTDGIGDPFCKKDAINGTGLGSSKSAVNVPAAICARMDRTKALLVFDHICFVLYEKSVQTFV